MENMDVNNILSQIRNIREQMSIDSPVISSQSVDKLSELSSDKSVKGFSEMLSEAVNSVNNEQAKAKDLATRYEKGDPSVDLPQVMIQSQKASVAFEAMTQVKNKLVKGYEDIINMSI